MKWKGRRQSKNVEDAKPTVGRLLKRMASASTGIGNPGLGEMDADSELGREMAHQKHGADERFRRKQRGEVSRESLKYANGGFVQNNMVRQKPTTKDYGGKSGKHSKVTGNHVNYGYAKGK